MTVQFRRGTLNDARDTFDVFRRSIMDLGDRLGVMPISGGHDPRVIEGLWERRQPLFEHLARTSDNYWVAEEDGKMIGLARSILRDGVRQLTEFFVLPGHQSRGIGRGLLERAFPREGSTHRFILATIDNRALPRYLKSGVYPLFPCYAFAREAQEQAIHSDLKFEPLTSNRPSLDRLNEIDRQVLGFAREQEHAWLIQNRHGVGYYRNDQLAGYGYLGSQQGPFAALDPQDFPAILAHAENRAAAAGDEFNVEVPLINHTAVDHLLQRGCQMEGFFEFVMADAAFGRLENYILTSPPFFV